VSFIAANFIDRFPVPSQHVVVSRNDVAGAATGIGVGNSNLAHSDISDNTTSGNRGNGIVLLQRNTDNVIRGNEAENNGANGILAQLGATANTFEQNSMHGNGTLNPQLFFDARDSNPLQDNGMLPNVWTGNDCDTDFPAGMICGVG
jgi:parallel beta-helix repeat protein